MFPNMLDKESGDQVPPLAKLYGSYVRLAYDTESPDSEERRKSVYQHLVDEGVKSLIKGNYDEETKLSLHRIILAAPTAPDDTWLKKYLDDIETEIKKRTGKSVDVNLN